MANEFDIVDKLGEVWSDFVVLEKGHPDDVNDFRFHIHALQNILLARLGEKAYKEYRNKECFNPIA